MGEINITKKKSISNYIASLSFLVAVIVITITLHFYNSYLSGQINEVKTKITGYESSILEVQKDERLQVYSLLKLNTDVINSYKMMNNVTKYINHMNATALKYNLEFSGFNLINWEVSSIVKIISDNEWIAFQKTRDFIKKYREDPNALFILEPISSFEWTDDITFKVNFKIK